MGRREGGQRKKQGLRWSGTEVAEVTVHKCNMWYNNLV